MGLRVGDAVPTGWVVAFDDDAGFGVAREVRLERLAVLRRSAVLLVPAVFIGWLQGTSTDETRDLVLPLVAVLGLISLLAVANVVRQVRRALGGVVLQVRGEGVEGWPEPNAGVRDYWRGLVHTSVADVAKVRFEAFPVTPNTSRFRVVMVLKSGLRLEGPEALLQLPALPELAALEAVAERLAKAAKVPLERA